MNMDPAGKAARPALKPEELLREHGDALYRYALGRVRSAEQAEDLVQDTFLAALRNPDRFRGDAQPRTYLIGILKHKIYDHYRQSARESRYNAGTEVEDLAALEAELFQPSGYWRYDRGPQDWSGGSSDPAAIYERSEFQSILQRCLAALSPRAARVFILREIDGSSGKEVCDMLGLSESNVGVILHRARLLLQQCIGSQWRPEQRG